MADTDEELVRKIHLEINGLTRPRRARAALEVSGTEHSHISSYELAPRLFEISCSPLALLPR
jgi:hypothetical protein